MKIEGSNYELYSIDYKLKKLKEHLSSILNNNKGIYDTEIQYLSSILLEYIKKLFNYKKLIFLLLKNLKKLLRI